MKRLGFSLLVALAVALATRARASCTGDTCPAHDCSDDPQVERDPLRSGDSW